MANSTKRDVFGLSVSKVCGRCNNDLTPEHFNLPARCWECDVEHKAEQVAIEAALSPAERCQKALDKYRKEYSHLVQSQWELISQLTGQLEAIDPSGAITAAKEEGLFKPLTGEDSIPKNDWIIRNLEERYAKLTQG